MGSVRQEFGEGAMRIAFLCSMMSGASHGKTFRPGAGVVWRLVHCQVWCLVGNTWRLGGLPACLHRSSSQHGGQLISYMVTQGSKCGYFNWVAFCETQYHFHCTIRSPAGFKGKEIDSTLCRVVRTWRRQSRGRGTSLRPSLEKTICHMWYIAPNCALELCSSNRHITYFSFSFYLFRKDHFSYSSEEIKSSSHKLLLSAVSPLPPLTHT